MKRKKNADTDAADTEEIEEIETETPKPDDEPDAGDTHDDGGDGGGPNPYVLLFLDRLTNLRCLLDILIDMQGGDSQALAEARRTVSRGIGTDVNVDTDTAGAIGERSTIDPV